MKNEEIDKILNEELERQLAELRDALDTLDRATTTIVELELHNTTHTQLVATFKAGILKNELSKRRNESKKGV